MARWTTMTWQDFCIAFQRGRREGRVPWLRYTIFT